MKRFYTLFLGLLIVCSGFGQTVLTGPEQLGDEHVIDGDFPNADNWTVGIKWSIAGGVATYDDTGNNTLYCVDQVEKLTAGRRYKFQFTISNCSGDAWFIIADQTGVSLLGVQWVYPNGIYTVYATCALSASSLTIGIRAFTGSASSFDFDNFSVKEVTKEAGYVLTNDGKVLYYE